LKSRLWGGPPDVHLRGRMQILPFIYRVRRKVANTPVGLSLAERFRSFAGIFAPTGQKYLQER
jgi:hypothetical protein